MAVTFGEVTVNWRRVTNNRNVTASEEEHYGNNGTEGGTQWIW